MSQESEDEAMVMPFGMHKGKPMSKVPVKYLHWLWNDGKKDDEDCPVHGYIQRNMSVLQSENEDLEWD